MHKPFSFLIVQKLFCVMIDADMCKCAGYVFSFLQALIFHAFFLSS